MSPVKVLVVDDFEPIRNLIASVVQEAGFQVIGQASDGEEAVHKAKQLGPDLVLLDVGLPILNGIEVAKRILKGAAPQSKVLFLSQETSPDVVEEALGLGAMGYVQKARLLRDLLPAIESVRHGRRFVPANLKVPRSVEAATTETSHCQEVVF